MCERRWIQNARKPITTTQIINAQITQHNKSTETIHGSIQQQHRCTTQNTESVRNDSCNWSPKLEWQQLKRPRPGGHDAWRRHWRNMCKIRGNNWPAGKQNWFSLWGLLRFWWLSLLLAPKESSAPGPRWALDSKASDLPSPSLSKPWIQGRF